MQQPSKIGALWGHQISSADQVDARFAKGVKRIVLQIATGGGKSRVAVELICRAIARGQRCLFLAHRTELITQFAETLGQFDVENGIIMAGYPSNPSANVQVASVQTIARRAADSMGYDLVVIDECHRTMALTYRNVLDSSPKAHVLGLTATPWRLDGQGLGDIYDELIVGATASDLVESGTLIDPRFYVAQAPDLRSVRVVRGEYDERAVAELMLSSKLCGDIIEHWSKHAAGRQTIAFGCNVEHSKAIQSRFAGAGISAAHLDGETPRLLRAKVIEDFRAGRTQVLCNVDICTEGFDHPETSALVYAAPTKSLTKFMQAVGRVMRVAPGKSDAVVLDHAGGVQTFGRPTDPRNYTLASTAANDDVEPPQRRCTACKAILADGRSVCAHCGHLHGKKDEPDVQVPGESKLALVELATTPGIDERAAQTPCPRCQRRYQSRSPLGPFVVGISCMCGRRYYYTDLEAAKGADYAQKMDQWQAFQIEAIARGFKSGWAGFMFKDTWGVWPRMRRAS